MVLTANTTFMLGEQRFHFTIPDSDWPTQQEQCQRAMKVEAMHGWIRVHSERLQYIVDFHASAIADGDSGGPGLNPGTGKCD